MIFRLARQFAQVDTTRSVAGEIWSSTKRFASIRC